MKKVLLVTALVSSALVFSGSASAFQKLWISKSTSDTVSVTLTFPNTYTTQVNIAPYKYVPAGTNINSTSGGTGSIPTKTLSGIMLNCNGQNIPVAAGSIYVCNVTGSGVVSWTSASNSVPAAGKVSY